MPAVAAAVPIVADAPPTRPFRHSWLAPEPEPEALPQPSPAPVSLTLPDAATTVDLSVQQADEPGPVSTAEPPMLDADTVARLAALEARIDEQDAALRRVLTLMVDWVEGEHLGVEPTVAAVADAAPEPLGYVPIRGAAAA